MSKSTISFTNLASKSQFKVKLHWRIFSFFIFDADGLNKISCSPRRLGAWRQRCCRNLSLTLALSMKRQAMLARGILRWFSRVASGHSWMRHSPLHATPSEPIALEEKKSTKEQSWALAFFFYINVVLLENHKCPALQKSIHANQNSHRAKIFVMIASFITNTKKDFLFKGSFYVLLKCRGY